MVLAILDIDEVVLSFRDNEDTDTDTEDTESTIHDVPVVASLYMSISIIISLLRIPLSSVDRPATLGSLCWRHGNGLH